MTERQPFDSGNPSDVMADLFRRQTGEMALAALESPIYRNMEPMQQVQSFMAGVMTGMICVCFAHIRPEGRDAMMRFIRQYLRQARQQAECIRDAHGEKASGT